MIIIWKLEGAETAKVEASVAVLKQEEFKNPSLQE